MNGESDTFSMATIGNSSEGSSNCHCSIF
ncbi:hypothetical protein PMALA_053990, partial [Plasmodium malariae]